MSEWIDVTDAPKKDGLYIVAGIMTDGSELEYQGVYKYDRGKWLEYDVWKHEWIETDEVLFYMAFPPLPVGQPIEPPKEE